MVLLSITNESYTMMTKYIKQCTLRERKYYWSCWSYKGVACPSYMVHLDLLGLLFVLLWPPRLNHDHLMILYLIFSIGDVY